MNAPTQLRLASIGALLIATAITIKVFLSLDGFWEDEFFQIAFLNEGFPHFFVQVARLDQHPPFHFLQLKLWNTLFSSDKGLLLNSVFWHLVSLGTIFWVGRSWLGTSAGLLAAALFGLIPQVISASVNLRMYPMIPALAIMAWWMNIRFLTGSGKRWWQWGTLIGVQLALGYSHAIAVYFVAWIAVAAGVQVFVSQKDAAHWKQWLVAQSCAAVLLLPLVVSAVVRISMPGQGEAGGNSDPGTLITHLGGMVAGWGMTWEYGKPLGAAFYALAVALGIWNKPTRPLTAVMLLGPYAFAAVIGFFVAPLFKTPVYSAMLIPFACLGLAGGLMAMREDAGAWLAITLLAIMSALAYSATQHLVDRHSPYQPLAIELKRLARPGDVVVVPKPYLYWAIMRYSVGPDWGSPLEVLPPLSDNWKRLLGKLGPELATHLKLFPKTNFIEHQGIRYVIGEEARAETATAKRVWVIHRLRYPTVPHLDEGLLETGVVAELGKPEVTRLTLFERHGS